MHPERKFKEISTARFTACGESRVPAAFGQSQFLSTMRPLLTKSSPGGKERLEQNGASFVSEGDE